MKKHVILVSMIVATMFATSCSKDDGDNVEQPVAKEVQNEDNNSEVQNVATRPIVIKAKNGATLSKVATTDGYNFTFSKGDNLVLTDGTTTYATLEMEGEGGSSSATFKGEISTAADNKSIYAVIEGQSPLSEVKTSTESLADVVQSNCYFKSENFDYNANSELSVTLNDQNAYLVFEVSENQKKVNIGSEWYDVSGGKCYAAVPAGEVSGRFFGTKTAKSSEIYTISRTDVVDLGVGNVLWKTANEPGGQMNYSTALSSYGTADNGYRLPSKEEYDALYDVTPSDGWTTENGTNGWKFTNDKGSVFFPAAGFSAGNNVGIEGDYWSSSPADDYNAYILYFEDGFAEVCPEGVDFGFSVRLVRGL